jgi:hypothetical protein
MPSPKRPLTVTSLVALVLTITAAQFLRAWVALASFAFYSEQLGALLPVYFASSGLIWGALGLLLANGLWRGRAWAQKGAVWGLAAFAAVGWFDRLVLQPGGPQQVNWPFQILVTIVLLAAVFAAGALPQTQAFFGDKHERTLKNRRT